VKRLGHLREKDVSSNDTVRNRVLTGALRLFNRKGYAAATVREIVAEAGVTKPVLYYYFGNKEGVYLDLIRESFAHVDVIIDELDRMEGSVRERILWFTDRIFTLADANIEQVRLMHAIYYGPPRGAPFFDFEAYHRKIQQSVQRLIVEGIGIGEFKDLGVEEAMWAVVGAFNIAIEVRLCHPEWDLGRAGLVRILGVIFEGISAVPEEHGSPDTCHT